MVARLDRIAWVVRASEVLASDGVEAIRVEALARDLEVTKGSFYWHFADRRALLDAILDDWRRTATFEVIDRVEANGGEARERLRFLIRICSSGEADRFEAALRAWAMTDPLAQSAVREVDEAREAYVTRLLVEHGFGRAEARRRSHALYLILIGTFTWTSHGGAPAPRGLVDTITQMVLVP